LLGVGWAIGAVRICFGLCLCMRLCLCPSVSVSVSIMCLFQTSLLLLGGGWAVGAVASDEKRSVGSAAVASSPRMLMYASRHTYKGDNTLP